jgi:hypothetical protein
MKPYYFRKPLDAGKSYALLLVDHLKRVLKTDGTLAPVGSEFDDATFLHPMIAFPYPLETIYEAVVNVADDTDPVTCSVFVVEVDGDELIAPTTFDNWYIDPTGERDVFGSLKEPVQVTQTVVHQHYAPPIRG